MDTKRILDKIDVIDKESTNKHLACKTNYTTVSSFSLGNALPITNTHTMVRTGRGETVAVNVTKVEQEEVGEW